MPNDSFDRRSDHEPEGRYADQFRIGYRSCVFVLDFNQSFHEDDGNRVHTRIVTSPEALMELTALLQKSIAQYEDRHGPIFTGDYGSSGKRA